MNAETYIEQKAKELAEKVAENFCAKHSVWISSSDYQALKANLVKEILTTLQLPELLLDKARLNWLEKEDKKTNLGCLYAGARPPIKGAGSEGGLSIRTAIDSAIAQQKEKKV
jgi:hypothetical protein